VGLTNGSLLAAACWISNVWALTHGYVFINFVMSLYLAGKHPNFGWVFGVN
jgi:hypothetical protein